MAQLPWLLLLRAYAADAAACRAAAGHPELWQLLATSHLRCYAEATANSAGYSRNLLLRSRCKHSSRFSPLHLSRCCCCITATEQSICKRRNLDSVRCRLLKALAAVHLLPTALLLFGEEKTISCDVDWICCCLQLLLVQLLSQALLLC
jgi:hypothetical protein